MEKESQKKHKLLVVSQLFYPELISTGQTITELCEQLAQDKRLDIETICAPPSLAKNIKTKRVMTHQGMRIQRLRSTSFPKLNILGKLLNHLSYSILLFIHLLFRTNNKLILTFTNPPFVPMICALIHKLKKIDFIFVVFDVYPDTAIKHDVISKNGLIAKVWLALNKFTYNYAKKIIVIGRCMETVMKTHIPKQHHHKIEHIPVWCDDKTIQKNSPKKSPFTEKWNLTNQFVLLYSGNMGRFHDIKTILECAKKLKGHTDITFLFVGDGHQKKWAQDYSRKEALTQCQFHDYVKREELGSLLTSADCGLVSLMESQLGLSVPSKSFGLLAAGLPIIGLLPENSEITHIITENNCGVRIKNNDVQGLYETILKLKNNPKHVQELGKNGKKAIEDIYSLKKTSAAYLQLIDDVFKEKSS